MESFEIGEDVTVHSAGNTHPHASVASRIFAQVIDIVLIGVLLLSLLLPIPIEALQRIEPLIYLVGMGYLVVLEAIYGQTAGKWLADIKVIRKGDRELGWRGSIIRNLLRHIDVLPVFYIIGITTITLTDQSQRIGDLGADSIVVDTSES